MAESAIESEYQQVVRDAMAHLGSGRPFDALLSFQSFMDLHCGGLSSEIQLHCMRWVATIEEQAGHPEKAIEAYGTILGLIDATHAMYRSIVLSHAKLLAKIGRPLDALAAMEVLLHTLSGFSLMERLGVLKAHSETSKSLGQKFSAIYLQEIESVEQELAILCIPAEYGVLDAHDKIAWLHQQHHAANRRYSQMILAVSAMEAQEEKREAMRKYGTSEDVGYFAAMALEQLTALA